MQISIFNEIREKRIKGYRNEPNRLREDAEHESAIVDDYQGRAVLELLQNADDAQFSLDSNLDAQRIGDCFVEFELNKELLIIRNGGYPISPEGVISLASTRISPKDKKIMIGNKGIGFKSVLELTNQPIIHSPPIHFEFSEEYTRKLLREENLLYILEKTRYLPVLRLPIELQSDQARGGSVQWATEIQLPLRDQKAYEKSVAMLDRIGPEVLIFLQGLKVIKYTGLDKEVYFSCHRENNIPGELEDGEVIISEQSGEPLRYYRWSKPEPIPAETSKELPRNWQDLTHGQIAMAILLDEEGYGDKSSENKIRVYFPTEEFSPVRILIHGNFRTDSTRKRINHAESYNKWLSGLSGPLLKEKIIRGVLSNSPNDEGKILDYLEPRIDIEKMAGIEKEIWLSIHKHLTDYPFIRVAKSQKKVSPQRICLPPDLIKDSLKDLYPQDCDIEGRYIPENSFFSSHARTNALLAFGAEKLTPERIIEFLGNVARPNPEWSAMAISLIGTLIQSEPHYRMIENTHEDYWESLVELCCNTSIFFCSDGKLRKAEQSCPLFLPREEKEDSLPLSPEFLSFAFLSKEVFQELIRKSKKGFEDLFVKPDHTGIHSFNNNSILEKAVLPWLQKNHPSPDEALELREFLFDLMGITKTDWDEPWNERKNIRSIMCQFCVPIRDDEEAPAWQAYAGKEWTGDESLEKLYGNREDRFFLEGPKQEWDEKTKKNWEAFYRWLGVSWRPKALPYHLPGEEKQDSTWNNDTKSFSFQGKEVSNKAWKKYCQWLYDEKEVKNCWNEDVFDRKPHMEDNRFLDGWEQISRNLSLGKMALELLTKETVESNDKAIIKYSSNLQKDYKNVTWEPPSFLAHALKGTSWLPALDKRGKTHQPPFNLFIPDSQLHRALTEILPCLDSGDELSKQAEDFLNEIGVRSEFRELNSEDWRRWASSIRDRFPDPDKEEVERVTTFYRRLLNEFPLPGNNSDKPPLEDVDILAFRDEQLGYQKPSACWYLDRPEYKDLPVKEEWFFAVKLGKMAKKCEKIFGLRPFSQALLTEPLACPIDEGLTDKLGKWFESRQPFLLARMYVERPKSREKDSLQMKDLKIQCVKSLKVRYQIQDRKIVRTENAFLETSLNEGHAVLYLFSNIITKPYNACRELVLQIARNIEYLFSAPYKDAFKSILSCKDSELIEELEDAHVPPDLIEECRKSLKESEKVKKPKREEIEETEPEEEVKNDKGEGEGEDRSSEETSPPPDSAEETKESQEKTPKRSAEEIPLKYTPEYIGGELGLLTKTGGGGGGGGVGETAEHDRKETGDRGEDILFNEFNNNPQGLGLQDVYKAFHKSKEDKSSIYDIEILDRKKGKIFLEVKSSGSDRTILNFEMPDKQWEFAKENQERYQLWFVLDVWSKSPKISGPHNPLELEKQEKLIRNRKEEIVYLCKVKLRE